MSWQPIETAPKDGTSLILFRYGYLESMAICWWHVAYEEWTPVNGSVFPNPTHWMPLPPPPEEP